MVLWVQTLMPNMLTNDTMGKLHGPTFGDQQESSISVDLWQKAFHDAFKRLCPVRAKGHECGCLPILSKMVCILEDILSIQSSLIIFITGRLPNGYFSFYRLNI